MANLHIKRGSTAALNTEIVEDGSLLVSTDEKKVSFDIGNARTTITSGEEFINYGSAEPTANLVANKTVWIG